MALISVGVSYKNSVAFSKTLLLNTEKVGEIVANSTYADFYYEDYGRKTTKYTTSSLTKDQLVALVEDSTLYNDRLELPVIGKSLVKRNKLNDLDLFTSTVYNIDAKKVIDAWDIDTDTCYLRCELGNKYVLYKIDDVIANIESASSTSVSII